MVFFLIWLAQAPYLCALSFLVATWAAPVEFKLVTWEVGAGFWCQSLQLNIFNVAAACA